MCFIVIVMLPIWRHKICTYDMSHILNHSKYLLISYVYAIDYILLSLTILQGSVSSSVIGFFAGFGDLAKEVETGLNPGEGCEDLVYEKDGGSDGVNSEGLGVHLLYLGEEDGTVYNPENTTDPVNIDVMRW